MKNRTAAAAAAFLALAALTGCGAAEGSPAGEPAATPPAAETLGSDAGFAPVPEQAAGGPGFSEPAKFGDTVTFPNGVEATVRAGRARAVTEDDMVEHDPGQVIVDYTLVVKNGSSERIDGMGGAELDAGENFDAEVFLIEDNSIGAMFPGDTKKAHFERMLQEADAAKVRITVKDPTFAGPDAVFEGSIR